MTITGIIGKTMKDAADKDVEIKASTNLHAVRKTYGGIKLLNDAPYWSDDGH